MALEAQNNPFTSVLFVGAADPEALPDADPSAGSYRLVIDDTGAAWIVDETGTATAVGGSSGLTDPMTTRGDVIIRNASNVTDRLAKGAASTFLKSDGTDVSYGVPILSYSENRLTGDVSIATAGTFVDGPSLTLGAGTWMMDGYIEVTIAAGGWINVRLLEGSTVRAASETFQTTGTAGSTIPISAVVVLSGSTTVKIQATVSSPTTGTIKTTPATNNTNETNLGSYLRAVRIA